MAYQSRLKIITTENGEQRLDCFEPSLDKSDEASEAFSKALREAGTSEAENEF